MSLKYLMVVNGNFVSAFYRRLIENIYLSYSIIKFPFNNLEISVWGPLPRGRLPVVVVLFFLIGLHSLIQLLETPEDSGIHDPFLFSITLVLAKASQSHSI